MKKKLILFLVYSIFSTNSLAISDTDTTLQLILRQVTIEREYEQVINDFEKHFNFLDLAVIIKLTNSGADKETIKNTMVNMIGENKLVIMARIPTGDLFSLLGERVIKSVKYSVGNPFTAQKLFNKNLAAGNYVPFIVNIYAVHDSTIIEYIKPSSLARQIGSDVETLAIGDALDVEIQKIIDAIQKH